MVHKSRTLKGSVLHLSFLECMTTYGRNTVATELVIYGAYTVVISSFTDVFVIVNDCIRSFKMVVIVGLGINPIISFAEVTDSTYFFVEAVMDERAKTNRTESN
jgi:hypothetical protein